MPFLEYVGPGLTWGRILTTCVKSMWSNDMKCKYMFMFPLQNLAHKGLTTPSQLSGEGDSTNPDFYIEA